MTRRSRTAVLSIRAGLLCARDRHGPDRSRTIGRRSWSTPSKRAWFRHGESRRGRRFRAGCRAVAFLVVFETRSGRLLLGECDGPPQRGSARSGRSLRQGRSCAVAKSGRHRDRRRRRRRDRVRAIVGLDEGLRARSVDSDRAGKVPPTRCREAGALQAVERPATRCQVYRGFRSSGPSGPPRAHRVRRGSEVDTQLRANRAQECSLDHRTAVQPASRRPLVQNGLSFSSGRRSQTS